MDIDHDDVLAAYEVPDWLRPNIIPPTCSVRALLDFPMFLVIDKDASTPAANPDIEFMFIKEEQPISKTELTSRSIPPVTLLRRLDTQVPDAAVAGYRYFRDWRHGNRPTPFFMVEFWNNQVRAMTAQRSWRKSEEYLIDLTKGSCQATAQAAAEALASFTGLGWEDSLKHADGTHLGISAEDVQPLLARQMLNGRILDAMVRKIQHQQGRGTHLEANPSPTRLEVRDLQAFVTFRLSALNDTTTYFLSRECLAVRELGCRIQRGELDRVYIPLNIHGNHWTLFCVNVGNRELDYGDPFGHHRLKNDNACVQRWLLLHQQGLYDIGDPLPMGHQPDNDAISCGVIVINSIRHALFEKALWTPATRDLCRVEEYMMIVRDHLYQKEPVSTFRRPKAVTHQH